MFHVFQSQVFRHRFFLGVKAWLRRQFGPAGRARSRHIHVPEKHTMCLEHMRVFLQKKEVRPGVKIFFSTTEV